MASGLYNSASKVVREALRLMEEQDRIRAIKFDQLRQDLRGGINSGESTPWNAVEIIREGRARREARKATIHSDLIYCA